MRVVIDALAADFGGIRTYVERLVTAWHGLQPDDDLMVVARPGARLAVPPSLVHELAVPSPDAIGRPIVQTTRLRTVVGRTAPDAVLATMPSTGLLRVDAPLAVVVHDLRHELRPEQFSRSRRLLRRVSYGRAYALADGFVAVSRRTLQDLHQLHPETRDRPARVVHHGADHVGRVGHVGRGAARTPGGPALAFAHHTNKRPDVVIATWARARERGLTLPDLVVVGAGARQQALECAVRQQGLEQQVRIAPYLPDAEYAALLRSAGLIVFPSDFEGFGLPVLEGMTLGIPVVIGPEPALLEVSGDHAVVASGWDPDAFVEAVGAAVARTAFASERAAAHARSFTWSATASATREFLAELGRRR